VRAGPAPTAVRAPEHRAFCSGTLVGEDVVLTAGHCVREISNNAEIPYVDSVSYVFGYRVESDGAPGASDIPDVQIFRGKAVIAGELFDKTDWALVRLERPVPPSIAVPVRTSRSTPVQKGQNIFVVGYPSGLPLKYAPNAEVRDVSDPAYFIANLDTFGGNSGSGVYDAASNALIGVLVRGETDYVKDETANCVRVNVCPSLGCNGEEITRVSLVPAP
jgi:V8-like Glu-specific endopeptidase